MAYLLTALRQVLKFFCNSFRGYAVLQVSKASCTVSCVCILALTVMERNPNITTLLFFLSCGDWLVKW